MAIIQRIQQSKRCFYTVLLLATCMLNGLYSQSYNTIAATSHASYASNASHQHHNLASSEHAMHETSQHSDCGSDAVCKMKCAWHCQLSQAMQPLPNMLSIDLQIASQLPNYDPSVIVKIRPDLSLRPPISI
jgi:hypothetical protein